MTEAREMPDLFRQRLVEMIDLRHPLAVLASRLPWSQIEASLAPLFARRARDGRVIEQDDLFGSSLQIAGAGAAAAGLPAPAHAPDGQPAVSQARLQAQRRRAGRTLGRERRVAALQRHDLL